MAGLSQLVIEVPSCDAFPQQDPRVESSSLTFQPYHQSSLHGEWLPRVNVPVRADRPRPVSPEVARSSVKPLRLKLLEYEEGPPSPTQQPQMGPMGGPGMGGPPMMAPLSPQRVDSGGGGPQQGGGPANGYAGQANGYAGGGAGGGGMPAAPMPIPAGAGPQGMM